MDAYLSRHATSDRMDSVLDVTALRMTMNNDKVKAHNFAGFTSIHLCVELCLLLVSQAVELRGILENILMTLSFKRVERVEMVCCALATAMPYPGMMKTRFASRSISEAPERRSTISWVSLST